MIRVKNAHSSLRAGSYHEWCGSNFHVGKLWFDAPEMDLIKHIRGVQDIKFQIKKIFIVGCNT